MFFSLDRLMTKNQILNTRCQQSFFVVQKIEEGSMKVGNVFIQVTFHRKFFFTNWTFVCLVAFPHEHWLCDDSYQLFVKILRHTLNICDVAFLHEQQQRDDSNFLFVKILWHKLNVCEVAFLHEQHLLHKLNICMTAFLHEY